MGKRIRAADDLLTLSPEAVDPSEDFDSLAPLCVQMPDLNLQKQTLRDMRRATAHAAARGED